MKLSPLRGLPLTLLFGCQDLSLADRIAEMDANGGQSTATPSSQGSGTTGGMPATGGVSVTAGMPATGGQTSGPTSSVASGGTVPATNTVVTGGSPSGGAATGGLRSSGGTSAPGSTRTSGGTTSGGTSAIESTRSSGGAPATGGTDGSGGAPSGGTSAIGSTRSSGGTPATGGVATGGVATGGVATGGVATGGVATGGSAMGGATSGGTSSGAGAATSGGTTSGVAAGGTSPSATSSFVTGGSQSTGGVAAGGGVPSSGGAPTGGTTTSGAIVGGTSATSIPCPNRITKSSVLQAAEPNPENPCARVSSVIFQDPAHYAFGFTNGEIYMVSTSDPKSASRADRWNPNGTWQSLPTAVVTALYAPPNNHEGSLMAGYADPTGSLQNPWYAAMVTRGWNAVSIEHPGTVLAISGCPFHSTSVHLALSTPWMMEASAATTPAFSATDTLLSTHLRISGGGEISVVETSRSQTTWRVYVGTASGELYKSNELVDPVVWDEARSDLSKPVTWSRITATGMPNSWVTRIAVHPTQPEKVLAVFGSRNGDAVWYSADAGSSWTKRSEGLPTASNPPEAPPIVGASFNPYLDGAAYLVTPQTSYFSEDSGETWREW